VTVVAECGGVRARTAPAGRRTEPVAPDVENVSVLCDLPGGIGTYSTNLSERNYLAEHSTSADFGAIAEIW